MPLQLCCVKQTTETYGTRQDDLASEAHTTDKLPDYFFSYSSVGTSITIRCKINASLQTWPTADSK